MKLNIFTLILLVALSACTKTAKNGLTVQGEIKGLKKGTLFLQKIEDGILSTVDSTIVEGSGHYTLHANDGLGELYFLSLEKSNEKSIPFFGEAGVVTINTNLEKFVVQAEISGSKNQEILDQYNAIASKFQNQSLEMIKERFEAHKEEDEEKLTALETKEKQLLKRKYLYTANFALRHPDSEVAPYLALTVLNSANIKLLDTINKSLSEEIKNSTYGKELNSYLEEVKREVERSEE